MYDGGHAGNVLDGYDIIAVDPRGDDDDDDDGSRVSVPRMRHEIEIARSRRARIEVSPCDRGMPIRRLGMSLGRTEDGPWTSPIDANEGKFRRWLGVLVERLRRHDDREFHQHRARFGASLDNCEGRCCRLALREERPQGRSSRLRVHEQIRRVGETILPPGGYWHSPSSRANG